MKYNQIENGAEYSWIDAKYLNDLPEFCFKYDVEDSRPFSNKRMKLLQTMFLAGVWGILCMQWYIGGHLEQKDSQALLDALILYFSLKGNSPKQGAVILNQLIKLYSIKADADMFFKTFDFISLNKSSYFFSNESSLHLYYTVTHFLTNKKYSLLEQLDFTAEMQHRILPLLQKD